MTTRADIVRIARSYIGTPFHHAARAPGIGLDCAGVLICVARELGLVDLNFDVPAYVQSPDGSMLKWFSLYMTQVKYGEMQSGDAVVFITDVIPQHLGVLGDYRHGGFSIIHAASNAHPPRVIETRLMFSRHLRFVAAGSFPGII